MFRTRILSALGAVGCLFCLAARAEAAEVDSGSLYCFSQEDFGESVAGICITDLPEAGQLLLGSRVLHTGDVLTAEQLARMTFAPAGTREDAAVQLGYLPIFDTYVAEPAAVTIGIRGRENKQPVAEDSAAETYKNLPAAGKLKVTDPEGEKLTFTLVRQPRRGTVTIGEDGSFTYTPKKNKVGVDSFTFTAADPAGNTSREATVTVTILKPSDNAQYSDTLGRDCRFAAEWMRHTGIFAGEQVAENPCFSPDRAVTRGEFVTMLVRTLDIPADPDLVYTGYADEVPAWLRPYLAAAMRAGLTAGLDPEIFGADAPITGAEAAVMLQNALDLTAETISPESPLPILAAGGIELEPEAVLTREQAALSLYRAAKLVEPETKGV